jgi:hypothetical protein
MFVDAIQQAVSLFDEPGVKHADDQDARFHFARELDVNLPACQDQRR